jgi:hypothetical protein
MKEFILAGLGLGFGLFIGFGTCLSRNDQDKEMQPIIELQRNVIKKAATYDGKPGVSIEDIAVLAEKLKYDAPIIEGNGLDYGVNYSQLKPWFKFRDIIEKHYVSKEDLERILAEK